MQVFSILYKNKNLRIKSLRDNNTSHDKMAAFFSGTDASTLNKEGMQMPHFLSLVVCNSGPYVAKLTSQVVSRFSEIKSFNGEIYNRESEPVVKIVCDDVELEIDEEPVNPLVSRVASRINSLKSNRFKNITPNKSVNKLICKDTEYSLYEDKDDENCLFGQYEEPSQPDDLQEPDSELIKTVGQLVTFDLNADVESYRDLDSYIRFEMDEVWKHAGINDRFLRNYLNIVVDNYAETESFIAYEECVQNLIDYLNQWKNPHIDIICNELQSWI